MMVSRKLTAHRWKACSGTMPEMRIYSGNLTLGDAGQPGNEQAITVRHTTFMSI